MANSEFQIPSTASTWHAVLLPLWPAWLTLIIALAITGVVWRMIAADAESDERTQFEGRVESITAAIASQLKAHEQVLLGARGLFNTKERVSREEWHAYVSSLQIENNYPGIQGVSFAKWLTAEQREAHVRAVRAGGFPDYDVRPDGVREFMVPILYAEPLSSRNQGALGYDLFSEPARRVVLESARDGNRFAATAKIMLVQEAKPDMQAGFLLYLPVYRKGAPADTIADRRTAIDGFVYAPFRMNRLMDAITGHSARDMSIEIYDGSNAAAENLMYRSDGTREATAARPSRFSLAKVLDVHDRKWTAKFDSRPEYEAKIEEKDAAVALATGIVVSLLLCGFVVLLLRTRARALQLAARMTFALRESEQRFDLAVQGSAQGVWERRFRGSPDAYFSARFKEMLGFTERELNKGFAQFESRIHPQDRDLFTAAMEAHLELRKRLEVDLRVQTKAEGFRWYRVHGQAIWDDAGRATRIAGSILDITERRESEQALRLSEERLKLALDGAGRALFDWNVESDEIYMSEHWSHIIGAPPGAMLTNTQVLADLIHPQDAPRQRELIMDTIKGQRSRYVVECRVLRKDGSWRWVQVEGQVVERRDGGRAQRLIGTIGDITERKEVEHAKSEFIAMVSHELRTPLTSIHGALSMAATGLAGDFDPEARAMLGIAHQNSQRLLRLANDILDIDRMEAGRMEFKMVRHELAPLAEQAVNEVRPYAETLDVGIELNVAEPLYVNVDEGRFVQVLTNLLANAAKFSPAGINIRVNVNRVDAAARVTVTDEGSGVAEDFRRQLFQKFAHSDATQARVLGGAGLGLNISRALTEAMGGRVGYYPAEGGGSAFYVELPVA